MTNRGGCVCVCFRPVHEKARPTQCGCAFLDIKNNFGLCLMLLLNSAHVRMRLPSLPCAEPNSSFNISWSIL